MAHLITFYSEGPPYDTGIPLGRAAAVLRAAYEPHVTSFVAYTPTTMANLTVAGVRGSEALKPQHALRENPGLSEVGGGAFKPFTILHRLGQLANGELLVWRDSNCLKHPPLLAGSARLANFASWVLSAAEASDAVWMP